jgi:hypothetical protein
MKITEDTLMTVASIIAGFGVTVLMFRLQRELDISDKHWEARRKSQEAVHTPTWIPLADWLAISAVLVALVVLPLFVSTGADITAPKAWCAVSVVLLAGYILCIFAHYRFIFWLHHDRTYFMLPEIALFVATVVAAWLVYRFIMSA